jgi:hypothetical protein
MDDADGIPGEAAGFVSGAGLRRSGRYGHQHCDTDNQQYHAG